MSTNAKVWGLLFMQPSQEAPITAHCYGDCGKVSMGGMVMDEQLGGIAICCEAKCPHLDEEMDEPVGTTVFHHERGNTTYDVYLRKVKA